jgi:hypothetical protein
MSIIGSRAHNEMASTSDTSVRARLERLERSELASDGLRSRADNAQKIFGFSR